MPTVKRKKVTIPAEPAPLWERQPWDTERSYNGFRLYLLMPRGKRSVHGAYRQFVSQDAQKTSHKSATPPPNWWQWSRGHDAKNQPIPGAVNWGDRVAAYDSYTDKQEQALWEARQIELRQREWEMGTKLLERAERMLAAVLFRRTIENDGGRSVTTLEPADWSEPDIGRSVKLAFDLQRRAASLPTETLQVNWENELEKAGIDPKLALEQAISAVMAGMEKQTEDVSPE